MKPSGTKQFGGAIQFSGICALLLFLCSCASHRSPHPILPEPVAFGSTAGDGDNIKIKIRLANGQELSQFIVDTGMPHTILDKSLEPQLGKRIGSGTFYEPFLGGLVKADVYPAPKLYLGSVSLLMGSRVYVYDLQKKEKGLMGILGVDCLRHYCIQFDFSRDEMRFLDPDAPAGGDFGRTIPLTIIAGIVIARADCFGTGKIFFCPDTGCSMCDAMLKPKLIRRLTKKGKSLWAATFTGINHDQKIIKGIPSGIFAGETYTDLTLSEWNGSWPDGELLGMSFFARNLVTFDFPKRTLFLKKQIAGPRNPEPFAEDAAEDGMEALLREGGLPGWATNESGGGDAPEAPKGFTNYPVHLTFNLHKDRAPGWADVTARVKTLAAGGAHEICAGNNLAGYDPAPNRKKKLQVTWVINERRDTVEAFEGKPLTLPANAEVLQGRYGFLSGPCAAPEPSNSNAIYHYTLVQEAHDGPWKLQKAWLTDKKGLLLKSYPVPKND